MGPKIHPQRGPKHCPQMRQKPHPQRESALPPNLDLNPIPKGGYAHCHVRHRISLPYGTETPTGTHLTTRGAERRCFPPPSHSRCSHPKHPPSRMKTPPNPPPLPRDSIQPHDPSPKQQQTLRITWQDPGLSHLVTKPSHDPRNVPSLWEHRNPGVPKQEVSARISADGFYL